MKILERFVINDNTWIEIAIAGFGKNTDTTVNPLQVYRYDRATIMLHTQQEKILLCQRKVEDIFFRLNVFLRRLIAKEIELPRKNYKGLVGRYHIIDEYKCFKYEKNMPKKLDYVHFLLYSHNNIDTWIYCDKKQVYLEISRVYD